MARCLVWMLAVLLGAAPARGVSFDIIHQPPSGGGVGSVAVSPEGSVVVGAASTSTAAYSFRWTAPGPSEILSSGSHAYGASEYGTVIVGADASGAYRLEGGQRTSLGVLPGHTFSTARDVSADGTTIVGNSARTGEGEAFIHRNGAMTGLGDLAGGMFYSTAHAVSADGSVVVGDGFTASGQEAFRWEGGVLQGLGHLPPLPGHPSNFSIALDVSADGSVVVGTSSSALFREAFRWENGVMTGLGKLDGCINPISVSVSGDGSTVVGGNSCESKIPFLSQVATIWTAEHGMRELKAVLEQDFGFDLTGIYLIGAAISSDGHTIAGPGYMNGSGPAGVVPIAWVAVIPEPSTLPLLALGLAAITSTRRHH